jgi:hypothetical protein
MVSFHRSLFAFALIGLFGGDWVRAQSEVRIADVTALPGDSGVTVILSLTTDVALTLLSVDIDFDRALCGQIENQSLRAVGRALEATQEGGLRCPETGEVSVVILNLLGDPAIPAGSGPIAEWTFDVRADAGGTYPLTVSVRQASNGPIEVPLSASGATLSLQAPCPGDCDDSGAVTIDELVRGVNVALDLAALDVCVALDRDGSLTVTIDELITAVDRTLNGCG